MEAQIPRTKDENINKEERYRACLALLIQISLIKFLCEETMDELQEIIADLYPSQVSAEQTRLKKILESLKTSEMAVNNNLQILEWDLLKHIHYPSEKEHFSNSLKDTNEELEKPCSIEPKEAVIEKQLRKCLVLRKNVESRMRVLEFLKKDWSSPSTGLQTAYLLEGYGFGKVSSTNGEFTLFHLWHSFIDLFLCNMVWCKYLEHHIQNI